jgi:hypothetical protein
MKKLERPAICAKCGESATLRLNITDLAKSLTAQAEEIKRLRDVLEEYTHHHPWCRVNKRTLEECTSGKWPKCDCGLMAALAPHDDPKAGGS